MVVRRLLLGLLLGLSFGCRVALAEAPAPEDEFTRALTLAREEASVTPADALRQLEALKQGRSGRELGLVLVEVSRAHYWLGDRKRAVDTAVEAEKLGNALHDDELLAKALLSHGNAVSTFLHDQEAAHRLIERAAQLASNTRDPHLQTKALVAQGLLAERDGRSAEATDLVTRAVSLARFSEDPDALSMALREQARLLASVGDDEQALALADELIALAKKRGIPAQLAHARLVEYAIAARAGSGKRAEKALEAAIDLLQGLQAKEKLAVPLANLAELYTQSRRYGEATRAATAALRIAHEAGDADGASLAAFQLGIADIYLRNIAEGRALVDKSLAALANDERYVRMLLDYGHALSQVGWGDLAMTVYEKAGAVSLAAWRKEKQLSYQALQRAYAYQKKQNELVALHHESVLKAAELQNVRRLRSLWVLLSVTTLAAVLAIALLYRRVAKANRSLKQKNEQLFLQSTRDSLTGLFNRHYFYEHVVPLHHAEESVEGGVFLLLDIDHFKGINDRFGHGAGDLVLNTVAARLGASLRDEDVLIRWGGEEFLAYLPGMGVAEARRVCTRLLAAVSSTPIEAEGQALTVSVSIGFCPKPGALADAAGAAPDWEKLVHLADLCLYLAKTAGRNQAFGISDALALTPQALAAADSDLRQASSDGLLELVSVKNAETASATS